MLGQSGVELLDPFIGRLARHRLPEVRTQTVESVDVLEGLDEMLLKSSDGLEGGNIELLIIGAMGPFDIGVILPLPLPDAQELDSEEVKGVGLQSSQFGKAVTPQTPHPNRSGRRVDA